MIAADGNHSGMRDRSLLKDDQVAGAGAQIGEADTEFAFVGAQNGVGASERLEYRVVYVYPRLVYGRDNILCGVGRAGNDVHSDFEASRHHAGGVLYAGLIIEIEFL